MLEAICTGLAEALCAQGIEAFSAFPAGEVQRRDGVAVGIRSARILPAAFGDYLGCGAAGEVFGSVCEAELALDIFCPPDAGAAGCAARVDALAEALWSAGGAAGRGALTVGGTEFDRVSGCLRLRCTCACRAWLERGRTDGGELSDFIVKGMIFIGEE